jgi:hypothetical protein
MAFTIIPESDIGREGLDITTGRRCFPKREEGAVEWRRRKPVERG